jgi:CMP-N,N'-diacetyllegionaminic acid synthase
MKIVTVILARGGSKGIPNKNIKKLNGKPLIQYAIDASKMSIVGEETYVSSDSEKILEVAERLGAKTIKRPNNISDDLDKSELALLDFVNRVDSDIVVFIQPTSPMIRAEDIDKGVLMLRDDESLNSVLSVYEEHWTPRWGNNRQPINWDIYNRPMRQEVENNYVENGTFYVSRTKLIKENKLRYTAPFDYVVMSQENSFQIDSLDDWKLISKILKSNE